MDVVALYAQGQIDQLRPGHVAPQAEVDHSKWRSAWHFCVIDMKPRG
ncbi:hypothetical protein [Nocardia sp. NPDC004123]